MARKSSTLLLLALLALAPALGGCENIDFDRMDLLGLNKKKPLPGDRKPLFPGGVPGVTQGIPPEYLKENQQQASDQIDPARYQQQPPPAAAAADDGAGAGAATGAGEQQAAVGAPLKTSDAAEPAPQAKPKPKPKKRVVKRKPKPAPPPPQAQPAQPAQAEPQPATAWPAPAQQQPAASWPAPPASGTFSR